MPQNWRVTPQTETRLNISLDLLIDGEKGLWQVSGGTPACQADGREG